MSIAFIGGIPLAIATMLGGLPNPGFPAHLVTPPVLVESLQPTQRRSTRRSARGAGINRSRIRTRAKHVKEVQRRTSINRRRHRHGINRRA